MIKRVETVWACGTVNVYEGDSTGNARAAEVRLLPCQLDLLRGLDRPLIKPLVQLAWERHVPEYLPLYPAGVSYREGGWARALAYMPSSTDRDAVTFLEAGHLVGMFGIAALVF